MNQQRIPFFTVSSSNCVPVCNPVKLHVCYACNFAVYFELASSSGIALTTNLKFMDF